MNYILIPRSSSARVKVNQPVSCKVSVLIAVRNNGESLAKNLDVLCNQDYPDYEVLVVDDGSDDHTASILTLASNKFSNLEVYRREKMSNEKGKRAALALGLEQSKGDYILFTDSDCKPSSIHWIKSMMEPVSVSNIEIVIGLSPYVLREGLLNRLIQFETSHTALLMLGRAKSGRAYMALGRNMLIKRSTLIEAEAFGAHKLLSGDDDLTVNAIAKANNTACCSKPEGMTFSPAARTWADYIKQKQRHFSAGKYYRFRDKFFLGVLSLGQALLLPLMFVFLIGGQESLFIGSLLLFLLRELLVVINFQRGRSFYGFNLDWKYVLLFDLVYPLYYLFFSVYIFCSDVRRW